VCKPARIRTISAASDHFMLGLRVKLCFAACAMSLGTGLLAAELHAGPSTPDVAATALYRTPYKFGKLVLEKSPDKGCFDSQGVIRHSSFRWVANST